MLRDARRAWKGGPEALAARQRARLGEMVSFARAHSPYYRRHYRGLPGRIADPTLLPVTSKRELMPRFDEWVTDPKVTVERARAFVADPDLVGAPFLDRYAVATTSGTTGTPGVFLMDGRSLAVTNALATRMLGSWLDLGDVARIVLGRGRTAMVMATGGHFASAVAAARLRSSPRRRDSVGVFPAHAPLPDLVARLNRFRPAVLAPYASMGLLLAGEQDAGRLRIDPALVVLAAEGLAERDYAFIAQAFGAKVRHSYAATECPFLSFSCAHDWLHVNADWVVLEPVDADHRPTPPGAPSHTVLLSNLANRVQPILRYDLGDGVLARPDPCPCGNPLPAIRVQGRAADVLAFPAWDGGRITIPPLAFGNLLDRLPGIGLAQIVQTAPTTLRVRLRIAEGADAEGVWRSVHEGLAELLAAHDLGHVAVERAAEPPEQAAGGKFREVVPLAAAKAIR